MKINEIITEEDTIRLSPKSKSAVAWIDKVYAKYPQTFQNNHVIPIDMTKNHEQFAMFELKPSMSKRDAVEVFWIQSYPLRQGVGGKAIKILQDLAREDNISLTLFPWDKGQVSKAALTKFYKRQGFSHIQKGGNTMSWSPVSEEIVNELTIDNASGWGAVPDNQNVDYLGVRVYMRPSVFLKLALPLEEPINPDLKKHIAGGGAVGAPFLYINIPPEWEDGDFSQYAKIRSHEGRNRMHIELELGSDDPVEVHLFPGGGMRARDVTDDMKIKMSQAMYAERSTTLVNGPLFTL